MRCCTWESHEVGTGSDNLILLVSLLGEERGKSNECVRSYCVGLSMWTSWHTALVGYAQVDETSESLLSTWGALCACVVP